jgi:hypothetical protein
LHGPIPRDHIDPLHSIGQPEINQNLRGNGAQYEGPPVQRPRSFDIEDLPFPYDDENPPFNGWISNVIKRGEEILTNAQAASHLCYASFGLDLAAIKYLLYDVGIDPNLHLVADGQRTGLHCVSMIEVLGDANSKSYIFAQLKAKTTWLTPILEPPLPLESHVPMASDIIHAMEKPAVRIAQWLLRAGADPNQRDITQNTPLHFAAYGGMDVLVTLLLEHGANPNVANREKRTPLHSAVALGHVKAAAALVKYGADLDAEDAFGVSPRQMIVNPGPIPKAEATLYFNLTQRDVRSIGRIANPELFPNDTKGWKHGDGGWGPERLSWVADDMHCDIDQYWAHEITGEELFDKYLARSSPVLIRGLLDDWPLVPLSTREALLRRHGDANVCKQLVFPSPSSVTLLA